MHTLHQKITYFIEYLDDDSKVTQQFNYSISFDEDPTAPLHLPISSFEKHNVDQALGGEHMTTSNLPSLLSTSARFTTSQSSRTSIEWRMT